MTEVHLPASSNNHSPAVTNSSVAQSSSTPASAPVTKAAPHANSNDAFHQIMHQIEYYFSLENLAKDAYLVKLMNPEHYVPIKVIADFPKIKAFNVSEDFLIDVMRKSEGVVVDEAGSMVKPAIHPLRTTVIISEVALTNPEEVRKVLLADVNDRIVSLERNANSWFVNFANEEDATQALNLLKTAVFNDKPVKARFKSENFATLYQQQQMMMYESIQHTGFPNSVVPMQPYFYNFGYMGYPNPAQYYYAMPVPPYSNKSSYRGGSGMHPPQNMMANNTNSQNFKGKGPKPNNSNSASGNNITGNNPNPKRSNNMGRPRGGNNMPMGVPLSGPAPSSGYVPNNQANNQSGPVHHPSNNTSTGNGPNNIGNNTGNNTGNNQPPHPTANPNYPQNGAPSNNSRGRPRGGSSKGKSKRKPQGQIAQVPQFTNINMFPPLPTQGEEDTPAYASNFKRYSSEQLVSVMKGMKQYPLPSSALTDCRIVLPQENITLSTEVKRVQKSPKKKPTPSSSASTQQGTDSQQQSPQPQHAVSVHQPTSTVAAQPLPEEKQK